MRKLLVCTLAVIGTLTVQATELNLDKREVKTAPKLKVSSIELDRDASGYLSLEETEKLNELKIAFSEVDKDQNRKIDPEEFNEFLNTMK